MIAAQVVIVASPGGARGDFVAGWLGTLSSFIDSFWSIDPQSGKSRGLMDNLKSLDYNENIDDVLARCKIKPDPESNLSWAGGCHGTKLKNFLPYILSNHIRILPISIKNADQERIRWEFVVKTYAEPRKTFVSCLQGHPPSIDNLIKVSPITDQSRVETLEHLLGGPAVTDSVENYLPKELLSNLVDYNDLFQPGGSHMLCDVLGIDSATERNHKFWDQMLPMAGSPEIISAWGQEFSIPR